MREWIRRVCNRAKKFDMLGSIWFANLDCMVNNIQYLQDDGGQCKQCGKSCQSDQSVESKQCCESNHHCTHHSNRTCNCAGYDCIDNDSDDPIVNIDRIYDTKYVVKYHDDVGYREGARGA